MTLLELVLIQMNCPSVKQLGKLDKWEKRYLAGLLEKLNPDLPSLDDWNQLLDVTLAMPAAADCTSAREQLISGLRNMGTRTVQLSQNDFVALFQSIK